MLEKKISFSLGSRTAVNENNIQTVYDDRRKAFFGSGLGSPAAEWFDLLEAALTWDELKTQNIARFSDGKMQYRFRIEAENLKRQPNEKIKSFIHRTKTLVDKGWPTPPDADANARTACENQRIGKYKDYLIRGLTTPGLKQKAHQALIEDPNKTLDPLQTLLINKDTSLVISAEMSGFQQSSSNSVTTDSRFTNFEKFSNEISNMVMNHQINATYDPNNPKMKQDFTRFCTYCKKFGHTVKFCWSLKRKKLNEEKHFLNKKRHTHRSTRTDQNRRIKTDRTRQIAITPKEDVATAPTLQTAIIAEVTVTLELFALKQDLRRLTRCMTQAIL